MNYYYNPASQVIRHERSNINYSWTRHENLSRSYTVDGLNRYGFAGPATLTYDPNGNLKSDGATTFGYDIENRLVSASGSYNAALAYDPLGRLFEVSGGGLTTRFLYDGDALVGEYNGSNALVRRYAHSVGTDVPLVWYEGGSARRWLFADPQGSVFAVTDQADALLHENTYDEYGIPGLTNAGRFQYTGQIWLAELGMYHYKARLYSPTLGRFLQTDPIGYEDQFNLYAYVGNDPINLVDPSGEATEEMQRGSDVQGSDVVGGVAAAHEGIEAGAEATGASSRELAPVRAISRGLNGVGKAMRYNEMRQEGRSIASSAAGATADEGTGLLIGAVVGSVVAPGVGTLVGGLIGNAADNLLGVGDRVGDEVADTVSWIENGGPGAAIDRATSEVVRHVLGSDLYSETDGR